VSIPAVDTAAIQTWTCLCVP